MATITRKNLARNLAENVGLSIADSEKFVNNVFEAIEDGLAKDKKVKILDFGTFEIRHKKARMGRNPKTQEKFKIKERNVVLFRPTTKLKTGN
ncbi:MAG: hypothetical protein B6I23_00260 [Rickettsiaceae bacterium 4572_127]|nr:MAG: hypothetical protein B6I23_00260 [Rickettsiaceae bacterium 4572_127]